MCLQCQDAKQSPATRVLTDSVRCAWPGVGEHKTGLTGIHEVIPLCGWVLSAGQLLVTMPGSLQAVRMEWPLGTAIM